MGKISKMSLNFEVIYKNNLLIIYIYIYIYLFIYFAFSFLILFFYIFQEPNIVLVFYSFLNAF